MVEFFMSPPALLIGAVLLVICLVMALLYRYAEKGRSIDFSLWKIHISIGESKSPDTKPLANGTEVCATPTKNGFGELGWAEFMESLELLSAHVETYRPDAIVGLADGMIAAAILSVNQPTDRFAGFNPIHCLGVRIRRSGNRSESRHIDLLGTDCIPDLTGKKVLLIDDHIYTGATMQVAVDFLRTRNPLEIRTMVVFENEMEEKQFVPDIRGKTIKGGRKRVPWSYTEHHFKAYQT
jgi:hypoxanthine phosphoribosyltransferase